MAQIITRYGYAEKVSDPFNEWVTQRLLSDFASRTPRLEAPRPAAQYPPTIGVLEDRQDE